MKMRKYENNIEEGKELAPDYHKVREFFIQLGDAEFTYARWDWMMTHPMLQKENIHRIGLWEEADKVVGLVTFDTSVGNIYCLALRDFEHIREEMVDYALKEFQTVEKFRLVIPDGDKDYQDLAFKKGLIPTRYRECDAVFYCQQDPIDYSLPKGFRITTMAETYDLYQYGKVLWKGFDHEADGEGPYQFTEEEKIGNERSMKRPNTDLNLKVAVVSPEGEFVSYCGMWYAPELKCGIIEPVATDPAYRKMGLGKAAVLEGIKRVKELGAEKVLVGSSQQFYYSIGMRPYATASEWMVK